MKHEKICGDFRQKLAVVEQEMKLDRGDVSESISLGSEEIAEELMKLGNEKKVLEDGKKSDEESDKESKRRYG